MKCTNCGRDMSGMDYITLRKYCSDSCKYLAYKKRNPVSASRFWVTQKNIGIVRILIEQGKTDTEIFHHMESL